MVESIIISLTWIVSIFIIVVGISINIKRTIELNGHKKRIQVAEENIDRIMLEIQRLDRNLTPEQKMRSYRGSAATPPQL